MEYRTLPPPTPGAGEARRKVLEDVAAIRAQILATRNGKPFDACEIDEALREVRAGQ